MGSYWASDERVVLAVNAERALCILAMSNGWNLDFPRRNDVGGLEE
jgi:hypothetical protein